MFRQHPLSPILEISRFEDLPDGVVLVHVWADWNQTDAAFARELELALQELQPVLAFSMNSDDEQFWPLLRSHEVTNVPALLVFAHGRFAGKRQGVASAAEIVRFVRDLEKLVG